MGRMRRADGAVSTQQRRAERILDAAAELVLRWGYKRVTIEDIAKRAAIGKGTIYLHWQTREALFLAVMARDSAQLCDQLLAVMREDPTEILLHRMAARTLLLMKEHPLMLALFTRDAEVLGSLVGERSAPPLRSQKFAFSQEYLELLRSHGLLRTEMALETQLYAVHATLVGFYLLDPLLPAEQRLPIDERAELIFETLRNAFEPPGPPEPKVLRALAPTVIAKVERLRDHYAQFAQGMKCPLGEHSQE